MDPPSISLPSPGKPPSGAAGARTPRSTTTSVGAAPSPRRRIVSVPKSTDYSNELSSNRPPSTEEARKRDSEIKNGSVHPLLDGGISWVDKLAVFSTLLSSISAVTDSYALEEAVQKSCCELLHAHKARLMFFDAKSKALLSKPGKTLPDIIHPAVGFAGQVALSGRAVNVANLSREPNFDARVDKPVDNDTHPRTLLCVPVLDAAKVVVAVLSVFDKIDSHFTNDDENLLRILARQVGVSLAQCLSFESLCQAKTKTQTLLDAGVEITSLLDCKSILFSASNHLRALIECEKAFVFLPDGPETVMTWVPAPPPPATNDPVHPIASQNSVAASAISSTLGGPSNSAVGSSHSSGVHHQHSNHSSAGVHHQHSSNSSGTQQHIGGVPLSGGGGGGDGGSAGSHGDRLVKKQFPILGILHHVLHEGTSVVIPNPGERNPDSRRPSIPTLAQTAGNGDAAAASSMLCVPIFKPGTQSIVGVIQALTKRNGAFGWEDEETAANIAKFVSVSLQNAKLFQNFNEIGEAAQNWRTVPSSDVEETIHALACEITRRVECKKAVVYVGDRQLDEVWYRTSDGKRVPATSGVRQGIVPMSMSQMTQLGSKPPKAPGKVAASTGNSSGGCEGDNYNQWANKNQLCVPVYDESGQVAAILQASNKVGGTFQTADFLTLRHMAREASVALARANVFEKYVDIQRTQDALIQCFTSVFTVNDTRDFHSVTATACCTLFQAENALLFLQDPNTYKLVTERDGSLLSFAQKRGLVGRVFSTGQPQVYNPANSEDDVAARLVANPYYDASIDNIIDAHVRSMMVVPVCFKNRKLGVLQVFNKNSRFDTFSKNDEAHIRHLVAMLFVALEQRFQANELARTQATMSKAMERMRGLTRAAQEVAQAKDFSSLVDALETHAMSLLASLSCTVYLRHRNNTVTMLVPSDNTYHEEHVPPTAFVYKMIDQQKALVQHESTPSEVGSSPPPSPELERASPCIMCVPLACGSYGIIGAIQVAYKHAGVYTEDDQFTLETLASIAAVAVSSYQLNQKAFKSVQFLEAIAVDVDLGANLSAIIANTRRLCDVELTSCFHVDRDRQTLTGYRDVFAVQTNNLTDAGPDANDENIKYDIETGRGIAGAVVDGAGVLVLDNPTSDARFDPEVDLFHLPDKEVRNLLAIPIQNYHGHTVGVVEACNKNGTFDLLDQTLLRVFGNYVFANLENAKLLLRAQQSKERNLDLVTMAKKIFGHRDVVVTARAALKAAKKLCGPTMSAHVYLPDPNIEKLWNKFDDRGNTSSCHLSGAIAHVATTADLINITNRPEDDGAAAHENGGGAGASEAAGQSFSEKKPRKNSLELASREHTPSKPNISIDPTPTASSSGGPRTRSKVEKPRSVLCAPVILSTMEVVGVIHLTRATPFLSADEEMLVSIVGVLGVSLETLPDFPMRDRTKMLSKD